jgi:hypothetical protein
MEHDLPLFFAALPAWKAAILVVVLPTAIAMFGPVLMRRIFGIERLIVNNEIAGFKFAVVGVIYGLLLTFAAISTWDKFSEAQVSVIEEAAAASAIYQLTRAGPEKSESVRDSRIGRIMIHHVGWKGGRHGWQNPIRRIYVTAWYWRFYQVNPGAMWLAGLMSVRAA